VFHDARWHPIVYVVHMLNYLIDRDGRNAITSCPAHEGHPRQTCVLDQRENTWHCKHCGRGGDVIDFVSLALFRPKKIDAARWIIQQARILPDPDRFPPK
jgi:hypothetical protein